MCERSFTFNEAQAVLKVSKLKKDIAKLRAALARFLSKDYCGGNPRTCDCSVCLGWRIFDETRPEE